MKSKDPVLVACILLGLAGWIISPDAAAQEYNWETEGNFTGNFAPSVFGPPSGLKYYWTSQAGIQGGGLKLDPDIISSGRTFTLTSRPFPVLKEGDRIRASIDVLFDMWRASVSYPVVSIFIAPASQAPDVFKTDDNSYGEVYLSDTYTSNPPSYVKLVTRAAIKYTPNLATSEKLEFPSKYSTYLLTLSIEMVGLADGRLQLTSRLTGTGLGPGVTVSTVDLPSASQLTDPNWRIGLKIGNTITAIDNFRFSYIPRVEPAMEGAVLSLVPEGIRLDWTVPQGVLFDLYRSFDLLNWDGPLLENSGTGNFLDLSGPSIPVFYALAYSGQDFTLAGDDGRTLPGVATESWGGLTHGHVSYAPATGYAFEALPDGTIYPVIDSTAEGGCRFRDSQGREILMTAPVSLNNGYTIPALYNFKIGSDNLDTTAYSIFDPAELTGPVPDLKGVTTLAWSPELHGWGTVPLPSNLSLVPSASIGRSLDAWSEGDIPKASPYLLIRQPIEVAPGGIIGSANGIPLAGWSVTDVSVFLRQSDGTLMSLGGNSMLWIAIINEPRLLPGTNYLEVYASYGVVSPEESPPLQTTFEAPWLLGDAVAQAMPQFDFLGSPWNITDAASASAPSPYGQVLACEGSGDGLVSLQGALRYPDLSIEVAFGRPAIDGDAIRFWFRGTSSGNGFDSGWFVFLAGSSQGSDLINADGARVGLGYRDPSGGDSIIASDLDTPALSAWVVSHGMRNAVAENWVLKIRSEGARIQISLSERGDNSTPATDLPMQELFDFNDSHFPDDFAGDFAMEGVSQPFWIGSIETRQTSIRGALSIFDSPTRIQSLDGLTTVPRYFIQDGQLYDRMGDGSFSSNANPNMISTALKHWVDYVPAVPLPIASAEELER